MRCDTQLSRTPLYKTHPLIEKGQSAQEGIRCIIFAARWLTESEMYLLDCPPPPPRKIFSMTITNSCAAGKEMPRNSKSTNLIYENSHRDIPKDRPRNFRNLGYIILPIRKYFTSDLVLHYSSRISGCKQKCRFEPLRYWLEVSSWVVNDAPPPNDV